MDREQKFEKQFQVAKSVAYWMHQEKMVSTGYYFENIERELAKAGRRDELVLLRLLKKEVEEGNSKVHATCTRLNNMKYTRKWQNSELFKGININFREIERQVNETPETDAYEIYQRIKKSTLL